MLVPGRRLMGEQLAIIGDHHRFTGCDIAQTGEAEDIERDRFGSHRVFVGQQGFALARVQGSFGFSSVPTTFAR